MSRRDTGDADVVPQWTSLRQATVADILRVQAADGEWEASLADRVLLHLRLLSGRGEDSGMPVDRMEHSLQCATRAYRDNRPDEYVMCALLHDIGDLLAPHSHAEIAASIVRPFVDERLYWIVRQHALFQGYYFFHHLGVDRNARDRFAGHPWYGDAVEFCEKYDQCSFDPRYTSLPLEHFEPGLRICLAPRAGASRVTSAEAQELAARSGTT